MPRLGGGKEGLKYRTVLKGIHLKDTDTPLARTHNMSKYATWSMALYTPSCQGNQDSKDARVRTRVCVTCWRFQY